MVIIVALLLLIGSVEIWLSGAASNWRRNLVAVLTILLILVLSINLQITDFSLFSVLVGLISIFRLINIARLIHGHRQADYLSNVVHKSAAKLLIYLGIVSVAQFIVAVINISNHGLVLVIANLQFVCALALAGNLLRSFRQTAIKKSASYVKSQELPSLTVAIPARNETQDLEECLDSLVTSDYPKLEILVLDDCSQTKHTPEVIKGYAQAGVRFVEGEEPPHSWTAKNYAYQQLMEQASSELIMFCGVDVRFQPSTLRLMVNELISRKTKMASFMPLNSGDDLGLIQKLAIQPWRYFRELTLPKGPAVLSTCWVIATDALVEAGGFKAVSRDILPERYFARQLKSKETGYAFLRTIGSGIKFVCQKDYPAQLSTAKRTLYPLQGNNLEGALLGAAQETTLMIMPFVLFVAGAISANLWLCLISLASYLILGFCFWMVAKLTYGKSSLWAVVFMPYLATFNIYQLLKSMYLYEFSNVIWKDRNVCIPIMRATVS